MSNLSKRMKTYENVSKTFLTIGCPKIIRLDMRAGHTFCKKFKRPFDSIFSECMIETAIELCKQIPGVVTAYTQSDEISLVLNDIHNEKNIECFFEGNVEKICSISASICTLEFNRIYADKVQNLIIETDEDKKYKEIYTEKLWKAQFDSRIFCLPNITEVCNYILWRQFDATRNSIQMVGQAYFTQKELNGKKCNEIQDMLMVYKGINWNNFETRYKRGSIIVRETYQNVVNDNIVTRHRWERQTIPILTTNPNFIRELYDKKLSVS